MEAGCLVEEPGAILGLVYPSLDQARGSDISMLVTKRMGASYVERELRIVFAQFGQHVLRGDELLVIIDDALKPGDLPD